MELTNKDYDEIVTKIVQNIINQSAYADKKIILWDFQQTAPMDRLYYNVACLVADLFDFPIYLQMPFFEYLKFKRKRKTRKNLHWVRRNADWVCAECKTSVYIIMDFIREYFDINPSVFEEINDAYYGWID